MLLFIAFFISLVVAYLYKVIKTKIYLNKIVAIESDIK